MSLRPATYILRVFLKAAPGVSKDKISPVLPGPPVPPSEAGSPQTCLYEHSSSLVLRRVFWSWRGLLLTYLTDLAISVLAWDPFMTLMISFMCSKLGLCSHPKHRRSDCSCSQMLSRSGDGVLELAQGTLSCPQCWVLKDCLQRSLMTLTETTRKISGSRLAWAI